MQQSGFGEADAGEFGPDDFIGTGAADGQPFTPEELATVTQEELDGFDMTDYIEDNTGLPPEEPLIVNEDTGPTWASENPTYDEGLFREFNEIPQRILDRAVQREVSSRFEDALDTVLGQDDEPIVDTEFALPDDLELTGSLGDEGWVEPHTSVEANKYAGSRTTGTPGTDVDRSVSLAPAGVDRNRAL